MFTAEFLKSNNLKSCTVSGRFNSKRNSVYLLDLENMDGSKSEKVFKLHNYRSRMAKEAEMLFILKNGRAMVPRVEKVIGNGILMEYISGPTLLDYFAWQENIHWQYKEPFVDHSIEALEMLVNWMAAFYRSNQKLTGKKVVLGNANFRNFIIRHDLYGVDFEDCREGDREEDAGLLCAFALTYDPAFTLWKKILVQRLVALLSDKLELDKKYLIDCLYAEIERINKRRNIRLGASWIEDIMKPL